MGEIKDTKETTIGYHTFLSTFLFTLFAGSAPNITCNFLSVLPIHHHFLHQPRLGGFRASLAHDQDGRLLSAKICAGVRFTPHSPRAGFATEESSRGVDISNIRERGRWASEQSFKTYLEVEAAFHLGGIGTALVKIPHFPPSPRSFFLRPSYSAPEKTSRLGGFRAVYHHQARFFFLRPSYEGRHGTRAFVDQEPKPEGKLQNFCGPRAFVDQEPKPGATRERFCFAWLHQPEVLFLFEDFALTMAMGKTFHPALPAQPEVVLEGPGRQKRCLTLKAKEDHTTSPYIKLKQKVIWLVVSDVR